MAHDVHVGLAPVRVANPIAVQLDDLASVDALAADLCVRLRAVSSRLELGGRDDRRSLLLPAAAHAATSVPSGVTTSTDAPWISESGMAITPGSPTTTMRNRSGCRCRWAALSTSCVVTARTRVR